MLEDIIHSYLYTQYNDDDNIRTFITVYNTMAKNIYSWMRTANLPIFVGGYNSGDQLRWIARGIYGVKPPVLTSGQQLVFEAFNTFTFNTVPFNTREVINQSEQAVVSDDLFKRITTWNFYKGDEFCFTVLWLRRRIMRFLTGINGVDVMNDQHWSIPVSSSGGGASVSVIKGFKKLAGSPVYDTQMLNSGAYNQRTSVLIKSSEYEYTSLFRQALDSGPLHIPFYQPANVIIIR